MAEALQRSSLTLRRLAGMSLAEIATRTRQGTSKWAERWRPPAQGPTPRRSARRFPAARFFPGPAEPDLARLLQERCHGEKERILGAAEKLLHGRFDLLGYADLDFGAPVDWHLDPVAGRRSPQRHWSRIDPLDPALVGDSKVVWELNRHQWLVTLAQAYRLSGDEHYARACVLHLESWRRANPRGLGVNWTSSLEVAFRIVSWSWVWALLQEARAFDDDARAQLVAGIAEHATHVDRYLSLYFSPNTHLTGEALGLLYAGIVATPHSQARRWRERGTALLVAEIPRQVRPDGVHFEQATGYQRYTAEIALNFLALARPAAIKVPPVVVERTERMLDALLTLALPDRTLPAIGDADGGWLIPFTRREPADARGVFGLAAALLGRGDGAWAAGDVVPEVVWMLGRGGVTAFDGITPRPPAFNPSRLLPDGGYAVLSTGWSGDAHQVVLDAGPLGCPISSAHGHADFLSIGFAAHGVPCVVDPGTYVYTTGARWRSHFRSARAHSTVTVDGLEPATPAGTFSWTSRPRARLRTFWATEGFDYADGELHALERHGLLLRRRVLFVKPWGVLIADEIEGTGEHRIEINFQLAALPLTREKDGWLRLFTGPGRGLLLGCFGNETPELTVETGRRDPIGGWIAPDYGRKHPAPAARFSVRSLLPARVFSLLIPFDESRPYPPELTLLDGDGRPRGLRIADLSLTVLFHENELSLEGD